MIARGFKPVAWVAAIGSAALCCYMLSLQVASERAELAGLERRIVEAHRDIRALQTELGTRGRLQQLEQWNAEVLALSAPVSGQYLESTLSLARFDAPERSFAASDVRLAAAERPPSDAAPRPAQPQVRLASAASPAAAEPQPLVRRAGLQTPPALAAAAAPERSAPARTRAAATPPRPAVQARSLLDEGTLRDLTAESRSEREGGIRN